MGDMVLEIQLSDGSWLDVLQFVAHKGIKWSRSDLDSSSSTRMLDGKLRRQRIATKIRLDVTCKPLKTSEASRLLKALLPEFVQVRYTDPMEGSVVTKTMYSNNIPASHLILVDGGESLWDDIKFPLIEQ